MGRDIAGLVTGGIERNSSSWGASCLSCRKAEAEIFYCFSEVMQQQRDAFCKALDPTDAGVRGRLSRLDALLRHKVRHWPAGGGPSGKNAGGMAAAFLLRIPGERTQLPKSKRAIMQFVCSFGCLCLRTRRSGCTSPQ